ncbi:MAG: hypothetical protein ACTHL1_12145 [Burkholderiaceae bacterium]
MVPVYTVDGNNNLQQAGRRALVETIVYDAAGRKLSTTNGNGETTTYRYDLRGNVTATTQPLGQLTRDAYDAQGRKVAEVDANGNVATWRYDYYGQLQAHTDIGGAVYSYVYDHARQLLGQGNSRGQNLSYQYDAAGQQIRLTDHALGQTTEYAYNGAGQHVREKTIQNGVTYQDTHLAYDALGRLRAVDDGRVALVYDYDALGNRTHEHTHVETVQDVTRDQDLYYAYDAMNRQTVVDAVDAQGDIVQGQGHLIGYDLTGNRTSDTSIGNRITAGSGNSVLAGYVFTSTGQPLLDESDDPFHRFDEFDDSQYLTAQLGSAAMVHEQTTVNCHDEGEERCRRPTRWVAARTRTGRSTLSIFDLICPYDVHEHGERRWQPQRKESSYRLPRHKKRRSLRLRSVWD